MPSIADAVERNNLRYAAGGGPGESPKPPNAPFIAAPPQDLPVQAPQRGTIPIELVNAADINDSNRMFRGQGVRSATFPYPNTRKTGNTTIVQVAAATPSSSAATLAIMVNGAPTPVQKVLDLLAGTGVTLTPDATGGVTITATATGDGLTHSSVPWESDPAYFVLRDDFHAMLGIAINNGTQTTLGIGQLGWNLIQSQCLSPGYYNGSLPNFGMYGWDNNANPQATGWLCLAPQNATLQSANYAPGGWALVENPGWQATFVFQWDTDKSSSGPQAFSTTQKAFYAGFSAPTFLGAALASSPSMSRPDVFVGVRFDTSPALSFTLTSVAAGTGVYTGTITNGGANAYAGYRFTVTGFANGANNVVSKVCTASTTTTLTLDNSSSVLESHAATATAPGLADTSFTFEAVANSTLSTIGRNNTQGTTFATGVVPTAGQFYRLDMVCSSAGNITMTLNGAHSFTAVMPKLSMTGSVTGQVSNNKALVSWTVDTNLSSSVWADGSQVTASGFTAGRVALNTTFTLAASLAARFTADFTHGTISPGTDTNVTLSGYPALTPIFLFGNDDQISPTASTAFVGIDYFSIIGNVNLGPNAPGTLDVTKSRYF